MARNFSNFNDNVLVLVPNDSYGGAEQYLMNITLYFLMHDYRAIVVFLGTRKLDTWANVENVGAELIYLNCNKERRSIFLLTKLLFRLSRRRKIKWTFSSFSHLNGFLGFLRRIYFFKTENLIVRESTMIFERFTGLRLLLFKIFYLLGYSGSDIIICQTNLMKAQLIENLKFARRWNVHVIANPISIESIKSKENEKFSLPQQILGNYIVAAGRLIELKGFDILIESFSKIIHEYDLQLVILGDGKCLGQLRQLVQKLDIESKVIFLGFVSNPVPFFKNADVCVVSSFVEGFPNVLLQMMSQNTRVVCTLCAGDIENIPGIITCRPNDSNSLRNAIISAIQLPSHDYDARITLDNYLSNRSVGGFISQINAFLPSAFDGTNLISLV